MASFLTLKEGIYDPKKRFAVTNILSEDFKFSWDGVENTIKSGDTVELPHHLMVLVVTKMVDKLMLEEAWEANKKIHKTTPWVDSNKNMSLGVPEARKVYEDKIVKEIPFDEASSQFKIISSQQMEQIKKDLQAEPAQPVNSFSPSREEFAELGK